MKLKFKYKEFTVDTFKMVDGEEISFKKPYTKIVLVSPTLEKHFGMIHDYFFKRADLVPENGVTKDEQKQMYKGYVKTNPITLMFATSMEDKVSNFVDSKGISHTKVKLGVKSLFKRIFGVNQDIDYEEIKDKKETKKEEKQ